MFTPDGESIRDRVCDFRKFGKVTQQDMALYLDMKRTTYRHLEANGSFKWDQIELIADYFDTSPYFIKYGITEEELRSLAKNVKNSGVSRLSQPTLTIFGSLEEYVNETELYSQFLSLEDEDQKRIKKYIETNDI